MAAGGFNTGLAGTIDRSIQKSVGNIVNMLNAQDKYQREVDRRAFDIINKFPEDINFSKVDSVTRAALQPFAIKQKQNYANKAKLLAQTRVGSPEFMQLQEELSNIKQSYINANDNLIDLQAKRAEWSANRSRISKGVHGEDIPMEAFDKLLLPEAAYTSSYDEFGTPTYSVTVGEKDYTITNSDLNWYEKDDEFALYADKTAIDASKLGASGILMTNDPNDHNYQRLKNSLSITLDNGGLERYKSIISDNLFDNVGLDLTPEERMTYLKDPMSAKGTIMEKMMSHFLVINKSGHDIYRKNLQAQDNGFKPTPGDQFDIMSFSGTFNDAQNFINSNPSAEQVKNVVVQSDIANAGKYATGKELNDMVEDGDYNDNTLYFYSTDAKGNLEANPINLSPEAIFDVYMNAYGAPDNIKAYYKNKLEFPKQGNNQSPENLLLQPNLTPDQQIKLDQYMKNLSGSLNAVNRTGKPRTDEEILGTL